MKPTTLKSTIGYLIIFWSATAVASNAQSPDQQPPQAQQQIQNALESNDVNSPPTGDMILDDVLQIIRQRGSVLSGSALDPSRLPIVNDQSTAANVKADGEDAVYEAAEQLLKAARVLKRLPNGDPGRGQLIRAMRQQAARLLIEAMASPASHD